MLFQNSWDFGIDVAKEDMYMYMVKYYDETWWNYFQVSGGKKELRSIWLNSAIGEGQSQGGAKDTVWIKKIWLRAGSWEALEHLQLKSV